MAGFCQSIQPSPCVVTDQRPNGITSYTNIDRTPGVLAALLAILGAAVLGQFAVVSGRRRRRDFAILKALGLLRRQINSITAWQISILTGLALLLVALALPLTTLRRARHVPLATASAAAYAVFLVHAALDWDWEVPAATLPALVCGWSLFFWTRPEGASRKAGPASR